MKQPRFRIVWFYFEFLTPRLLAHRLVFKNNSGKHHTPSIWEAPELLYLTIDITVTDWKKSSSDFSVGLFSYILSVFVLQISSIKIRKVGFDRYSSFKKFLISLSTADANRNPTWQEVVVMISIVVAWCIGSLNPIVAKVGGLQRQDSKGEAVVNLLRTLGNAGSGVLRLSAG